MNHPFLTIIVPVYNEERTVAHVLQRLHDGPYAAEQVIVVDNGTEVVSYEVGDCVVMHYNPQGQYFSVAEPVEVRVVVRTFMTKNGPRYSLVIEADRIDGEF